MQFQECNKKTINKNKLETLQWRTQSFKSQDCFNQQPQA